jgi:nucleotide sugar dehydrogenase
MKKTVGIIGNGFVGESQAFSFSPTSDVKIYDVNPLKSTHTLSEVLKQKFIFVCLPTPMDINGIQDLSFIESFFSEIPNNIESIFIIKSTILPGTTKRLIDKFNLKIIFSPEFLTERTSKLDMLTQARIVLGGDPNLTNEVKSLFVERFMNRNYIITDSTTAELIKYMNNTYFATKISLMNEYFRLSEKLGVDWETAKYGFVSDGRIADSHLHIPGPDGKLGFGGTCFPKDINALINLGKELNTPMNVLEAAWKTNLEIRPEQDWLELKGRAISK